MTSEHGHEHKPGHSHKHADGQGHTHSHEHTHLEDHDQAHEPSSNRGSADATPQLDLARIAVLLNNWIDHNRGHRRTYLEWRDRLATAGLPTTVAALERVAALTDQMTAELHAAAAELGERLP